MRDVRLVRNAATGAVEFIACLVSDRADVPVGGKLDISAVFAAFGRDGALRGAYPGLATWPQATHGNFPTSPRWRVPVHAPSDLPLAAGAGLYAGTVANIRTSVCQPDTPQQHAPLCTPVTPARIATVSILTSMACEPAGTCGPLEQLRADACLVSLAHQRGPRARDVDMKTVALGPPGAWKGTVTHCVALNNPPARYTAEGSMAAFFNPAQQPPQMLFSGQLYENMSPMRRIGWHDPRIPGAILMFRSETNAINIAGYSNGGLAGHALVRSLLSPCQPMTDGSCPTLPRIEAFQEAPISIR